MTAFTPVTPHIDYQDGHLQIEGVFAEDLAKRFDTPLYVYSQAAITDAVLKYQDALKGRHAMLCYAVKANANLSILRLLSSLGAGFDIVSYGELLRVQKAQGHANNVVFSGVGKTHADIEAALLAGIYCFNVESFFELDLIQEVAHKLNRRAPVSIRVNPNIDAKTHPYISTGLRDNKFGIEFDSCLDAYLHASTLPNLDIIGLDCHIGSQLTQTTPFLEAVDALAGLIERLVDAGIVLKHLDLGGGLGVRYTDECPPSISSFVGALTKRLDAYECMQNLKLILEPGRSIVANSGALLTRVALEKTTPYKRFLVVDAAMNDLLRPALYQAVMDIVPAQARADAKEPCDIVGMVCESADCLGSARYIDAQAGDVLVVLGAGAYGFSMASNYNARVRPAEVLIDEGEARIIRKRESYEALWQDEC